MQTQTIRPFSEHDDVETIALTVSRRELRMMFDALISADPAMLARELPAIDLRAWDAVLDLVKDTALASL
jgi:hypothetical protein